MADENTSKTDKTEETTTEEKPKYITHDDLNAALASREKRLLASFKKLMKPAAQNEADDADDPVIDAPSKKQQEANPEYAKLQKQIEKQAKQLADFQKQAKQAKEEARSAKTRNSVTGLLKGKVIDDWADEATEKIIRGISFDDDGVPQVLINEVPHTLNEAVDLWLRDPGNKKFLPAPQVKPVTRASFLSTNALVQGNEAKGPPRTMSGEIDLEAAGEAIAGEFASVGLDFTDVMSGRAKIN